MNSFGHLFRISLFGESHGERMGVIIDGCPAGLPLAPADFLHDLQRRQSGFRGATTRVEANIPHLCAGLYNGHTTGAPLAILFDNRDTRPDDYAAFRDTPRPGHADFTATRKWNGFNDLRGGGHLSGRLTVLLVAAGVVAKKILTPVVITAELEEAGGQATVADAIDHAIAAGDSIGGIIRCTARQVPAGWGEPFFHPVESQISRLAFAIPGVNGIEFGDGFAAARRRGSTRNDRFIATDGTTATNNAGGINGGITSGNDLYFRVSVKPAASIARPQQTLNMTTGQMTDLLIPGRHDVCFALRLPVVVEAITAIALADFGQ
ncbi:MAG: chorismate synthase [Prevotellaceae bacterium]|jgi:chorismate synthase|nr:chorismate synthase [Prevotellaceae bacterium]